MSKLDLEITFTKCDQLEERSFCGVFHYFLLYSWLNFISVHYSIVSVAPSTVTDKHLILFAK